MLTLIYSTLHSNTALHQIARKLCAVRSTKVPSHLKVIGYSENQRYIYSKYISNIGLLCFRARARVSCSPSFVLPGTKYQVPLKNALFYLR